MSSSAADVDIEDGTRARARTGGVRLEIAEPWWTRFLRCSCNLAHCTTRMQRARVTEGWYHKASRAIDVGVLTFHLSLVSGKRRRGLRIGYLCSIFVRHRELEGVVPFNFKHREISQPGNLNQFQIYYRFYSYCYFLNLFQIVPNFPPFNFSPIFSSTEWILKLSPFR